MTRLTVPTAGTSPGRVARAQAVQGSDAPRALAKVGARLGDMLQALEADRLDRERRRAQVDLTNEVNDLRLDVQGIGDPDQAEATWRAGVDRLRGSYVGAGDVAPERVDPANAEQMGLIFDRLVGAAGFEIGRRNLELRNAQRDATWLQYRQTLINAAASDVDGPTREVMLDQGREILTDLQDRGIIDAAAAESRWQTLLAGEATARATARIAKDPQGFLAEVETGDFAGMDGETLARLKVSAERAITAEAEAARKAYVAQLDGDLSTLREIYGAGREADPELEAVLLDPEATGHEDFAQTMAARSLRDEGHRLAAMPPGQIRELIAQERDRPLRQDWETERLPLLERTLEDHEAGYASDPIGYRQATVGDVTALPDFDPSDPEAMARALSQRAEIANALQAEGYTDAMRFFSAEEQVQLRASLGLDQPPEDRLSLALSIATATGGAGLTELTPDPVLAHGVGLAVLPGGRAVAAEILRGQQALDAQTVVLPPAAERLGEVYEVAEDLFADLPTGDRTLATIMAASDALYARRTGHAPQEEDLDSDVYRDAMHAVMGGTGAYGSERATGGVQEVRGVATILPPGMRAYEAEFALRDIGYPVTGADTVGRARAAGRIFDPAQAVADLEAASGGRTPSIGGEPPTAEDLADMTLKAVGPDRYILTSEGEALADASGAPLVISLMALKHEVAR